MDDPYEERERIRKMEIMLQRIHFIRSGVTDVFKGIYDTWSPQSNTNKEQFVKGIKSNAEYVLQGIKKLEMLAGDIQGLMQPPPAGSVGSLSEDPLAMVDSTQIQELSQQNGIAPLNWFPPAESRCAYVYEQMNREQKEYMEPKELSHRTKRRKVEEEPEPAFTSLGHIWEQLSSRHPSFQMKKVTDPVLPHVVTGILFLFTKVFQGAIYFLQPRHPSRVIVERIEFWGLDEKEGPSHYHVFNAIAAQGRGALEYYSSKYTQDVLLRLLLWAASYGNLFTTECTGCGKILHQFASYNSTAPIFFPPFVRTFESLHPYHPQCVENCEI